MTMVSSGESAVESSSGEWEDLLEVPGTVVVDWIQVVNEGDWPGFFRLVEGDKTGVPCRLPCGGGESGERRASIHFPCRGFSGGRIQIKKGLLGGALSGLYAFAGV